MSETKKLAALKAIDYVEDGMIVGVGTGSTVAYFIDALAAIIELPAPLVADTRAVEPAQRDVSRRGFLRALTGRR